MVITLNSLDQFVERLSLPPLPAETRSAMQSLASLERFAGGSSLELDEAQGLIVFLARGSTKLVAHASEARDQIVAFHFAGDFYWVPAGDNYSYSLCALRDTELLTFPAEPFLEAVSGQPAVVRLLIRHITLALRRSREKTVALGRKTAAERMAVFLLSMAERIGIAKGEATLLDLPMSRRDIAESLGLTIETVSRQLTHLREAGLIRTEGRSCIQLNDLGRLRLHAGYREDAHD